MYMPHPPGNTIHVEITPHPQSGEPMACMRVVLDDGHAFEMFLSDAEFAGLTESMIEVLSALGFLRSQWVMIEASTVDGLHLMDTTAFGAGKRQALCGAAPQPGDSWEALPLLGPPETGHGLCAGCVDRWTEQPTREPT